MLTIVPKVSFTIARLLSQNTEIHESVLHRASFGTATMRWLRSTSGVDTLR
jgi:hypothetical protein